LADDERDEDVDELLASPDFLQNLVDAARAAVGGASQLGVDFLAASDALVWAMTSRGRERLARITDGSRAAYLVGVCRNQARNLLRRTLRYEQAEDLTNLLEERPSPQHEVVGREEWERLLALCEQNERLAEIVSSRLEDVSVPRIAERLGIAERTVYRELEKAREAIGWEPS